MPFKIGVSNRFTFSTSWVLWKHLLHPAAHPLFRLLLRTPPVRTGVRFIIGLLLPAVSLACCGIGLLLLQFKASILIPLLVALVFLSSNVYIILWVMGISATIAREHEKGTYDQICATPPGAMGANRAICVANLHRHDALTWINLSRKLITGLFLFVIAMILMVAVLNQRAFDVSQFLRVCLDIAVVTAASYIDHVLAIVMGCLVGMLVPVYRRTKADASLLAVGVFITLQAIIFLANLLAILLIVPALYQSLSITGWLADISPPLVSLLVFYGIREVFNVVLWKTLAYQLNASPLEFNPVLVPNQS